MDASIPDHVYHSMGIRDNVRFGRVICQTEDPEVAVLLGCDGAGGIEDGGRTPRLTGHCNPLDMRPSDNAADGQGRRIRWERPDENGVGEIGNCGREGDPCPNDD